MTNGEYQVSVMDHSGSQIDLIDMGRLDSMMYTRKINGIGALTLTFRSESDRAYGWYGNPDYLMEVYRNNVVEGTYLLRVNDLAERNDLETLILSGRSLEDLLRRRMIIPADDPTGAGGFSTKAGNADAVMIGYVTDQCVSPATNAERAISGLSTNTVLNVGNLTFQRLKEEDNLLDVLQNIAYQTGMDFSVVRTGGANFEFRAEFEGVNRTKTVNYPYAPFLLFDVRRGNMRRPRLVSNRADEVNLLWVGGQGPAESRIYVPVADTKAVQVSPWNRCEGTVDARNDETIDQLIASGGAELRETRAQTDLTFEPNLSTPSVQYKVDWDIGDWVTASYGGFEEDLRITEVEITLNNEGEQIRPRIENVRPVQ